MAYLRLEFPLFPLEAGRRRPAFLCFRNRSHRADRQTDSPLCTLEYCLVAQIGFAFREAEGNWLSRLRSAASAAARGGAAGRADLSHRREKYSSATRPR